MLKTRVVECEGESHDRPPSDLHAELCGRCDLMQRLAYDLVLEWPEVVELERCVQAVCIDEHDGSDQQGDRDASSSIRGWCRQCDRCLLPGTRTAPSHGMKSAALAASTDASDRSCGTGYDSSAVPLGSSGYCFERSVEDERDDMTPEFACGIEVFVFAQWLNVFSPDCISRRIEATGPCAVENYFERVDSSMASPIGTVTDT
jgi:hypothetical protein